jgi:23S rRNA (guanosine2251-2'-O)-methyltransferase
MLIYGINPVLEALRARRVTGLQVAPRADRRVREIERLASEQRVPVRRVSVEEVERAAGGAARHQGVVAEVSELAGPGGVSLDSLVAGAAATPLLVVLDGIEDPHNVGAILRTLDAAGGDGVVRQSRHAAPLGGVTAKASAGAVAHVKIVDVVNIARSLDALKDAGIWTVGLAGEAPTRYDEIDYTLPTAVVVGSEGTGLRRLVRERCDWLVSIPMRGHVQSLNVSVATGVVLFEARRQRDRRAAGDTAERPGSTSGAGRPTATKA